MKSDSEVLRAVSTANEVVLADPFAKQILDAEMVVAPGDAEN